LEAVCGKIADDLSTLSEAQEVPYGFKDAYDPFDSGEVDFESKTAWVIYDAKQLNLENITTVVKTTGEAYSVTEIERLESFK
jgi:hypothetical protein